MPSPIFLVLSIALSIFGCGLAPAPDPFSPTSGDGIAPWTDLGPAVVCINTATLGPPSSPAAGVCGSPARPATACNADSDCKSREACVCGLCTIAACDSASDCNAPRTCNFADNRCDTACTTADDCASGEDCIGSVCRGHCAKTSDCQHGEFCNASHVCVTTECADDTGCFGLTCEVQRTPTQVLEPGPVVVGGEIVLYLDLAYPTTPDQRAIWRAISTDGIHFTIYPAYPVLDDPTDSLRAPHAVQDGATTYVYFERNDGTELDVATATDGTTFGDPTPVLLGPDVHAPTAIHAAGGVVLYYERAGSIGLATGAVGSLLADQGTVLAPADVDVGDGTPGTAFWIDIATLASPHAELIDGDIHLWFAAFGQESAPATKDGSPYPIAPNYSVGYAGSELAAPGALTAWPYGPVADRVDAFLDHRDELGPAAVDAGDDRFFLYYVDASPAATATGAAGPFDLGRLGVLGSGAAGH